MTTTLPLAEVRDRLSPLVNAVQGTHERVVITKNGRPAAVIISVAELESLEETLDVLGDPTALTEISEALAGTARFSLNDVKGGLEPRVA